MHLDDAATFSLTGTWSIWSIPHYTDRPDNQLVMVLSPKSILCACLLFSPLVSVVEKAHFPSQTVHVQ